MRFLISLSAATGLAAASTGCNEAGGTIAAPLPGAWANAPAAVSATAAAHTVSSPLPRATRARDPRQQFLAVILGGMNTMASLLARSLRDLRLMRFERAPRHPGSRPGR